MPIDPKDPNNLSIHTFYIFFKEIFTTTKSFFVKPPSVLYYISFSPDLFWLQATSVFLTLLHFDLQVVKDQIFHTDLYKRSKILKVKSSEFSAIICRWIWLPSTILNLLMIVCGLCPYLPP